MVLLRRRLAQTQVAQRAVDPLPRQFFLNAVLAEACYRRSLEIDPDSEGTLLNLTSNLITQKKGVDAVAIARQLVDKTDSARAWKRLEFTNDPIAGSLRTSAANAKALGFLSDDNLDGIYDLTLLNKVLAANGATKVGT